MIKISDMNAIRVLGDLPVIVTIDHIVYEVKPLMVTDAAGTFGQIAAICTSPSPNPIALSGYFKDQVAAARALKLGFECNAQFGTQKAKILAELKKHPLVEKKVRCKRCSTLHFPATFGPYCSERCERMVTNASITKHTRSFAQDDAAARKAEKFQINNSSGQRRSFYTEPGRD